VLATLTPSIRSTVLTATSSSGGPT
jgi:hypothetical protein